MCLILKDRFWVVRIPFVRWVKLQFLAQFPMDHRAHLLSFFYFVSYGKKPHLGFLSTSKTNQLLVNSKFSSFMVERWSLCKKQTWLSAPHNRQAGRHIGLNLFLTDYVTDWDPWKNILIKKNNKKTNKKQTTPPAQSFEFPQKDSKGLTLRISLWNLNYFQLP